MERYGEFTKAFPAWGISTVTRYGAYTFRVPGRWDEGNTTMIQAQNLPISGLSRARLASYMVAALSALTLSVAPGAVAGAQSGDAGGQVLVSATQQAGSGARETIYRVAQGAELVVKQVCVDHPAVYVEVGRSRDRVSFRGSGCTSFNSGYVVAGGSDIRCLNRSGQRRSCSIMGVLHPRAHVRAGAKFYDVEDELAKADGETNARD